LDNTQESIQAVSFQRFAGNDANKWELLSKCTFENRSSLIWNCKLDHVESNNGEILLHILYDCEEHTSDSGRFMAKRFSEFFFIEQIHEDLEEVGTYIVQIENEIREAEIRKQEEERLAREREELRVRKEAERLARLEEERLQKEREAEAKKQFSELRAKYRIDKVKDVNPTSPLFKMLLQLENKEWLFDDDIKWLENRRLNLFLAEYFEWRYKNTGDVWNLIKAGKHFRLAKQADRVLELYKEVIFDDSKLQAASLTNQGGAYRDLKIWDEAKMCAKDALRLQESMYPHNLLGAVYYQSGEPAMGDEHFQKAVEFGAKLPEQDKLIKEAFKDSDEDTKRLVAEYLLGKDSARYKWAEYYLKKKK
jgi:tetratricopeptide (TPR) repeat protein